jgi:uncharacterized membrane protein (DUF2068 family)
VTEHGRLSGAQSHGGGLPLTAGVQAIIAFKLAKAIAEALVGLLAFDLLRRGAEAAAATLAEILLEHATQAWALSLATFIITSATTAHVKIAAFAAFADAALSAIEAFALRAGKWWAPWLVAGATASLLPWELYEIVRRPGWGRVVILLLNLLVVVYLLRGVAREHRAAEVDKGAGAP